jgi:hypothetical protein
LAFEKEAVACVVVFLPGLPSVTAVTVVLSDPTLALDTL